MKMYKQPITEIMAVDTEQMMQDVLNVSINSGTPSGGGGMHAPHRSVPIED